MAGTWLNASGAQLINASGSRFACADCPCGGCIDCPPSPPATLNLNVTGTACCYDADNTVAVNLSLTLAYDSEACGYSGSMPMNLFCDDVDNGDALAFAMTWDCNAWSGVGGVPQVGSFSYQIFNQDPRGSYTGVDGGSCAFFGADWLTPPTTTIS